jgi:hypothetical protein
MYSLGGIQKLASNRGVHSYDSGRAFGAISGALQTE